MFIVGDKVKVSSSGAIGVIKEMLDNNRVCVEFDGCAGSQTPFGFHELELIRPTADPSADVEFIQSDKGL